jgi:hypothetical protein
MRTSKLFRFISFVPFWGAMFLLLSFLLHRRVDWVGAAVFGILVAVLYTFLPPMWWLSKFRRLTSR